MHLKLCTAARGRLSQRACAIAVAGLCALSGTSSFAVSFEKGEINGSLDTTLSLGGVWRMEKRNDGIVGTANGGTAYSVNYDDGTLNFNRGLASSVAKITSEFEVNYKDFGFFARGTYFYDFELEDDDRLRTPLSRGCAQAQRIRTATFWMRCLLPLQHWRHAGRVSHRRAGGELGREHVHPGRQ